MLQVIVGLLVGALVGLAFPAWAMIPIAAVGATVAVGIELAEGSGVGSAIAASFTVIVAIELGYGLGLLSRKIDRLARKGTDTTAGPLPVNRV